MALRNVNPTTTQAWDELSRLYKETKDHHLAQWFRDDVQRATEMAISWDGFYLDYSKNRIDTQVRHQLLRLAKQVHLDEAIEKYFTGDLINRTEGRAVLHTALRAKESEDIRVDGKNIVPEVYHVREDIKAFTDAIISGEKRGYTGKTFTHVVNIGIGGSDLGPVMVARALAYYRNHLDVSFISNVDGDHVHEALDHLDPETTLFIIVSKTFTTQETLTNALTVKKWFLANATQEDVAYHFAAVSTNTKAIADFGIIDENVFPMWDWVGGRFSLWSAVGLSIALAVGYDNFEALLDGAQAMDHHFRTTEFERNLPVMLALIGVWYNNFYGAETEAVIPYTQYLDRFPAYLQQGSMESNGKSVDRDGHRVDYQTGTVIWGEPGTNSQHAFFQLIHQGTKLIPCDFIGFTHSLFDDTDHHNKLMANFFSQTEALMNGKPLAEVVGEMEQQGVDAKTIQALAPFKVFEGNKPTNTLLIDRLTPHNLGALIAMYEHKIFVQGVIWNIFSFDQWGVELGKKLAGAVLKDIEGPVISAHDASTTLLIEKFKSSKN